MKKLLLVLASFVFVVTARAQFFGGYGDAVTSVATGRNTIGEPLRIVYDDFTFDLAGDIISFALCGLDNTGSPVGMYYEIRSGMSAGNGGTLLFSGMQIGATFTPLPLDGSAGMPPSGSPGTYGFYNGGPTSTIHLAPGTYWIGLAPLESFGHFDVTSTQGLGSVGHPINNGNAFYFDSSNNFVSLGVNDFGIRLDTAQSTIPEPSSIVLLGLGALGLIWRKRSSSR